MKRLACRMFFLVFLFPATAKEGAAQGLDSIERVLHKEAHDSLTLKNLLALAKGYSYTDYQKALGYGKEAMQLAETLEDRKNLAWAYNYLGSTYYYRGDYDSALAFHRQALDIRTQIQDKKGLGASYNNIGNIYDDQGDPAQALDYYLKALKYFEEIDFKTGTGIVYNSLGRLYYLQKSYDLSLMYFQKSAELQKKLGNHLEVMHCYNNIAIIYDELKDKESALAYYKRSLDLAEQTGNTSSMVTTLGNMGQLYTRLNDPRQGEEMLRKAISLGTEMDDKAKLVVPYMNLGILFMDTKQYDSAEVYLEKGLLLSKEMGLKPNEKDAYQFLAMVYYKQGDAKKMHKYHTLYDQLKDSLFNAERSEQLAEMQTRYDTERIEQQNALLEKDKARDRVIIYFTIGIAAVMLLFAFFIYRSYRGMRKLNRILATQKVEILNKNHDLQEKNTLIQHQKKEITDSITYARNIQQALLPAADYIRSLLPGSFVLYKPKDIVSGDFYWFREKDDQVFFAAADSTGHGVPGGFMSMICTEKLNEALKQSSDPGEMLKLLNRSVKHALRQQGSDSIRDGMDIALCSLKGNVLRYAGANRPLFIVRADNRKEVEEVKADKVAIGGFTADEQEFAVHELQVKKGDMIYLFTDGYVDQFGGGQGKKFMAKRFKEELVGIASQSPENQKEALEKRIRDWMGGTWQVDDMLVLGIRI